MKKALKIVLFFFGSILLLLILILIFHNAIISYTLKSVIKNKSEGKAILHIKNFDLDLLDGSIVIEEPELLLSKFYMDSSKNMSINRIVFSRIEIDLIDLRLLITKRNISAKRFLLDKPVIWFTEQGAGTKSSFHPEKLIRILNHNPDIFKTLQIQIGDIEIYYGTINIAALGNQKANPGLVDFTILLHDFNSVSAQDTTGNRFLFSEELVFKLKNFNRKLKSGYLLSIDSAVFSTQNRGLTIGGFALFPESVDSSKNSVSLFAGRVVLNDIGLEEVRGLEDINLSSFHLSNGSFTTYQNVQPEKKNRADTLKAHLEILNDLLNEFDLDSLTVNRFNYYNINEVKDTTIIANDVNFLMTGIEIDSGMFADPFRNFIYDSIKLSTGIFKLHEVIPGMDINYRNLSYSNANKNLKVTGIIVSSDSSANKPDKIDLSITELDVKGFSLKRFQKQQTQRIAITLSNPVINAAIAELGNRQKTNKGKPFVPKHLQLEKVILQNGTINLTVKNQLGIALKGLNIDVEEFYFPDQEDADFRYQNLNFNYSNLIAQFENRKYNLVTGNLDYRDKELLLRNIKASMATGSSGQLNRFSLKYLELTEFEIDRLLFDDELRFAALKLGEPVLSGIFTPPQKRSSDTPALESQTKLLPLKFTIGGINIDRGKIDAVINLKEDALKLVLGYDLAIGALSANKGDSVSILLNRVLWDVEVSNSTIDHRGHKLYFKSMTTNSFKSEFWIDSLTIGSKPDLLKDSKKLEIRNILLPSLGFTGLDYKLLLEQDSLDFEKLIVQGLKLDLILPKTGQTKPVDPNKKIDLNEFLIFNYDTISFTGMEIDFEKPGDSSHTFFALENFNIGHRSNKSSGLNLIKNIEFNFESFSFLDTIANKYLNIQKGITNHEKMSFTLVGVEGSNLAKSNKAVNEISKSNFTFKSSQIKLENIFIRQQLPSKISVGRLFIANLEMDLETVGKLAKKEKERTTFKVDLEILRRFTKLITSLRVDTADFNDISVIYRNEKDTASTIFKMDSVALIVHDIDIDTTMIGQSQPNLINKLTIDLRGRTHISSDSLYEIRTGRLHYDFPNHQISIDSLYVIPRYVDSVFFKKAVYQTGRLNLFGRKIEINDIDVDALLFKDYIHFGSVDFRDFEIQLYRDKRFPMKPGLYKALPREALMAVSQKFTVDSIHFIDSRLDYKQFEIKSEYPGEIFLSDFNVTAYNVTNKLKEYDHETRIKVNLSAMIMGESLMKLSLFFPLYKDSTAFWLTGKVEELDMVRLNSMTENLMGIGIMRGKASIDIPLISGNDSIATGSLVFRYKKLKLALYNRKKDEVNTSFFSPIINFMINDLVLRSNNPRFASKPKIGLVYWKRDTRKGIVNYAFKGLLSGMLSTLGFNSKGQRQEKKDLKNTP